MECYDWTESFTIHAPLGFCELLSVLCLMRNLYLIEINVTLFSPCKYGYSSRIFMDCFGRTPYVQEHVNIGSGPPGSKVRWFRSSSDEPRFINTITFDTRDDSPTLVMVHGYAASQGFFFRNFDALASRFRVIAVDQLG